MIDWDGFKWDDADNDDDWYYVTHCFMDAG
jgi:hypothetical protein